MASSGKDKRIDYIEFNVSDIGRARSYCEFSDGGLKGGFTSEGEVRSGGPLVILFADNLADALKRVEKAGGKILKPVFSFPGGRRFHFADPDGYELAVWSDQ